MRVESFFQTHIPCSAIFLMYRCGKQLYQRARKSIHYLLFCVITSVSFFLFLFLVSSIILILYIMSSPSVLVGLISLGFRIPTIFELLYYSIYNYYFGSSDFGFIYFLINIIHKHMSKGVYKRSKNDHFTKKKFHRILNLHLKYLNYLTLN